jgi:hypothetical protein
MSLIRLGAHNAPRHVVVGQRTEGEDPSVCHVGLLAEAASLTPGVTCTVHHCGPPLEVSPAGTMAAHWVGDLELTKNEVEMIEDWLADLRVDRATLVRTWGEAWVSDAQRWSERLRLGLDGQGPWPVLLPAHLLHAVDAGRAALPCAQRGSERARVAARVAFASGGRPSDHWNAIGWAAAKSCVLPAVRSRLGAGRAAESRRHGRAPRRRSSDAATTRGLGPPAVGRHPDWARPRSLQLLKDARAAPLDRDERAPGATSRAPRAASRATVRPLRPPRRKPRIARGPSVFVRSRLASSTSLPDSHTSAKTPSMVALHRFLGLASPRGTGRSRRAASIARIFAMASGGRLECATAWQFGQIGRRSSIGSTPCSARTSLSGRR